MRGRRPDRPHPGHGDDPDHPGWAARGLPRHADPVAGLRAGPDPRDRHQAPPRHRHRRRRADPAQPVVPDRGGRHLAPGRPADPVPPGAGRSPRAPVPCRQVQDDGPRRRGHADGSRGGQRGPGARLQDDRRPTPQPVGPLAAPDEPRRAASAVERAARRDERRRASSAAAARGRRLRHLASPAAVDEAGDHRAVAGRRPARPGFRPVGPPRPRLHRPLVAVARPQDRRPDDPCRAGEAKGADRGPSPRRRTGCRRRTARSTSSRCAPCPGPGCRCSGSSDGSSRAARGRTS